MFAARKNARTTTAVCVSARFRLSSLNRMTAIIVAALLRSPRKTGTVRCLIYFFQKTATRSKPQPSASARGGLLTFFEKRAHRRMVFFGVNTLQVFLVNPSIVVPPTQNRAPQEAACD